MLEQIKNTNPNKITDFAELQKLLMPPLVETLKIKTLSF